MRATARQAVTIGTGMAHTVAAKTEAQRAVGLYLADEDDAANIGNPLADIMHRRGDVVGGKLSPDANDFLKALMGVAGYLTKQMQKVGHPAARGEAPAPAPPTQTYPDAPRERAAAPDPGAVAGLPRLSARAAPGRPRRKPARRAARGEEAA
jgi:hypothetical protein